MCIFVILGYSKVFWFLFLLVNKYFVYFRGFKWHFYHFRIFMEFLSFWSFQWNFGGWGYFTNVGNFRCIYVILKASISLGCKWLKIISTAKRVFFLVNEKLFQFDLFFQLPQAPKNEENVLWKIFVGSIFGKEDKLSLSNSNLK